MSKTVLLVLTVGLVCGLVGLAYGSNSATITVTAGVQTFASISPGTTDYAFATNLAMGTTYQAAWALLFTNDGAMPETFTVQLTSDVTWDFDTDQSGMGTVGGAVLQAKIGGNWGAAASDVTAMTQMTTTPAGPIASGILINGTTNLWLGIWTPPSLDTDVNAAGTATLTVTATTE